MKKIILAVFSIVSLGALTTACTSTDTEENTSTEIKADDQQNIDAEIVNSEPVNNDPLLAISSACIGCGKCAKIDPAHFEMSGHKAIVASQDNLDTNEVLQAIESCPAEAITL